MLAVREHCLKSRPVGMPSADNFQLATVTVPDPAPGEVQVKNIWMTVDPYMRGRMVDRASYVPPFKLGEPLQGGAIGEVAASNDPGLKRGDLVSTMFGWRELFNAPAANLQKLDTFGLPPQAFLGVAGMPGLTAWVGLLKIAALKPGDVVFVSAAAGAVGSVVCQIAKIKGHTVIGSAGGADKGAFLKQIGVDHVIDYKATGNLTEALLQAAPNGIDVYRLIWRGRRSPERRTISPSPRNPRPTRRATHPNTRCRTTIRAPDWRAFPFNVYAHNF